MKRLITVAAMLLTLGVAPLALAAAGPGKFESKLAGTGAKTQHGRLDGTWTISLTRRPTGTVKLTRNGERTGGGKYVISGKTITFTPKPGGTCTTKGRYRFKLSGSTLTFTRIKDACAVRRDVLTYGPWTKLG
jgi:hypothetical protein